MAELSCTRCDRPLSPGQPLCACGLPVPRGRARRAAAPQPAGRPAGGSESCTHAHLPAGVPLCDCGAFLGTTTPDGSTSTEGHNVELGLPWGTHRLELGQELDIGREVGPFQQQLAHYEHVSRRHATLRLTATGVLLVQDHASMNGTFLDGRRCPPTGTSEVQDGSEIGCGSTLTIRVRFEP